MSNTKIQDFGAIVGFGGIALLLIVWVMLVVGFVMAFVGWINYTTIYNNLLLGYFYLVGSAMIVIGVICTAGMEWYYNWREE